MYDCAVITNPEAGTGTAPAQALADISRLVLCCHSNEISAAIVNPRNSAQPGGAPCYSPKSHSGQCSSMGMRRGTDGQTDGHTNIHFASATPHAKCNEI